MKCSLFFLPSGPTETLAILSASAQMNGASWKLYMVFLMFPKLGFSQDQSYDPLLSGEPQNKNSTLCAPRSHTVKLSVNVCSAQQFLSLFNHEILSPTQNNNWHPREQTVKNVSLLHCSLFSHPYLFISELIYINHLLNVEKDKND